MAAGFGAFLKGFGASAARTRSEKKQEELEKERQAKQDSQFQQQLALQRENLAEARAERQADREDRLSQQSFMNKILQGREGRDEAAHKVDLEGKDLDLMMKRELVQPGLGDKRRRAYETNLDATIAKDENYVATLPLQNKILHFQTKLGEADLDMKHLELKDKKATFEESEKLRPYMDAMRGLQKRQAEAMAKKAELDVSVDAIERQKLTDHINLLRAGSGLIADLANITGQASDRKLRALHLSGEQLQDVAKRHTELTVELVKNGVPPDQAKTMARDLITDSFKIGHAIHNPKVGARMGDGSAASMQALTGWYGEAMNTLLTGDPAQAVAKAPEIKAALGKAIAAFSDYGKEENEKGGAFGGGPPFAPDDEEPAPKGKPSNFREFAAGNPNRVSDTREPMKLQMEDIPRLVFSKPGLKAAAAKALDSMYAVPGSGEFTDDQIAGWLMRELNKHPEIKGDTATRAAKLIESMPKAGTGRLSPDSGRSSGGGPRDPVGSWSWQSCAAGICTWRNSDTGQTMRLPKGQRPLQ